MSVGAASMGLTAGQASADTLWGMMFRGGAAQGTGSAANKPTYVATVNTTTGAGTVINTTPAQYVNDSIGIAINPLTGVLYGMTDNLGRINNQPLATLNARSMIFTIDPATANVAKVGNVVPSTSFFSEGDIKFNPKTGSLWAVSTNVTLANFVNADQTLLAGTTGSFLGSLPPPAEFIGNVVNFDISSFAFKPNGELFLLDTTYPTLSDRRARIYRVNHDSEAGTFEVQAFYQTQIPLGNVAGMTFDPITGDLLIADGDTDGQNKLFRFNFTTKTLSPVGDLNVNGPAGGNPNGPSIGLPDYYRGLAGLESGKVAPSAEVRWTSAEGGVFATGASWSSGASPNSSLANAVFGTANASGSTTAIVVDSNVTLGRLNFRSPVSYALTAPAVGSPGTLTMTGTNSVVAVSTGNHTIGVPVVLANDTTFEIFNGQSLGLTAGVSGAGGFQKSGLGTLNVSGNVTTTGAVRVLAGTLDVKTSGLSVGGSTVHVWAGATLAVRSNGGTTGGLATLLSAGALKVDGDEVMPAVLTFGKTRTGVPSGLGGLVAVNSLTVTGDSEPLGSRTYYGYFDLGDSDMVIRSGSVEAVRDLVRAGLSSGGSSGLVATGSSPDFNATLAVVANSDAGLATFDGEAVTASSILVKFTWKGDTNLDGVVNANDLVNVIEGFSNGLTGWQWGDFNYDGAVTEVDFELMANVSSLQTGSYGNSTGGPPAVGSTVVPEPASAGLVAIAGGMLLGRRRRGAR